MLFGRVTYELMENAWPAVARDQKAPRAMRDWAEKLEAKPKYVVSKTRSEFPWTNPHRIDGDLAEAVTRLKETTPKGVLVGAPSFRPRWRGWVRLVIHPILAGHGPRLFAQGFERSKQVELVDQARFASGAIAV